MKVKTRVTEHKKEVEKITEGINTRAKRKESVNEIHKSAIRDHAAQKNHVINWEETKTIAREDDFRKRGIREALRIRKQGKCMNRDEGRYQLSHIYDSLLKQGEGGQCST